MPFYTFKCRTCGLEQEEKRTMDDFKEPLCPTCCYNPEADGKYERMKKIFKPNAKPASKDGSWGFGGKKG
tara:strand:- start:584 stop:793 length:210 start_codon:yes stop_codon:yes gene_type:complete